MSTQLDLTNAIDLRIANTDARQLRIANVDVWGKWVETRRNRATQPVPYLTTGWTSNNGSNYTGTVDNVNVRRPGTASRRFNRLAANPGSTIASVYAIGYATINVLTSGVPVQPGDVITTSFWVAAHSPITALASSVALNASAAVVGSTVNGAYVEAAIDTWIRLSVTHTIPAGGAFVRPGALVNLQTPPSVGGEVSWMQDCLIETGSAVGEYFDGDTPATATKRYRWLGTPRQSASVEETYGGI